MKQVVVLVMSEFGRPGRENSAAGTYHGRATAMFVLGGRVRRGRVYGRWPGLAPGQTDPDGNLVVTTDYRGVLAEVVERRLGNRDPRAVFPDFELAYLNLVEGSE